jgi:beta-N-acetylhexosaminidase
MNRFKPKNNSLGRACALFFSITLLVTQQVSAISQAQKDAFSEGIYYFNTEASQCSADGTSQTVNSTMPTAVTDQIEQTLIVGFSDASLADSQALTAFVHDHPYIGGIFFHGDADTTDFSPSYFTALQQEAKVPLLITSDDEGGDIHRFLASGSEPSGGTMGKATADQDKATGTDVGTKLKAAGINTLLGPVLDTYHSENTNNADNLGSTDFNNSRSFGTGGTEGSDAQNIIDKAGAFADGVNSAGIGIVYKHFPGIGQLTVNTDTGTGDSLGSATNPLKLADITNDLSPYQALANKDNGAIMFSNAHVDAWDGGKVPVSESADAVHYVRSSTGINFQGVIMSDDLGVPLDAGSNQPALADGNTDGARLVTALSAGVNMPLVTLTGDPTTFMTAVDTAVGSNPGAMSAVTASLGKIATYKSAVTGTTVGGPGGTSDQTTSGGGLNCSCTAGTNIVSGTNNVATVLNYLQTNIGMGFTQAIGVTANLQRESGTNIDPTAIGGPAHGIAQWQEGRWANLQAFADKQNKPWTDLGLQLDFMKQEIPSYPTLLSTINADTDAKAVAHDWLRIYEGASDPDADTKNSTNVDNLLAKYNNGSSGVSTNAAVATDSSGGSGCGTSAGFSASAGDNAAVISCPTDPGIICTKSIYYSQYEGPWANLTFSSQCDTVGHCGCGLTSTAMAIATLKNDPSITPQTLLPDWQQDGLAGDGTTWDINGWQKIGDKYGLNITQLFAHSSAGMSTSEIQQIVDAVTSGALVGVSGQGTTPFTSGGHFILIRGYNPATKQFLISDPNNNLSSLTTTNQPWGWDMLTNNGQSAWKITE